MEEKERYEIHVYDDCCVDLYDNGVLDKSITDTWELEKLLNQQSKRIKKLETKLAECEKSKESYRLQNEQHHLQLLQFYSRLGVEAFGADIHEKALETLMIMKEQLAEKDKEIEQLKKFDDLNKTFFDLFRTAFKEPDKVDDLFNTLKTIQEKQDQDKISFAVEQLEIARKLIDELLDNCGDKQYKVWEVFDSQIKQLNEGK